MVGEFFLFWGIALVLSGAVAMLMIMAILRTRGTENTSASDIGVYRDQLAEVDRDLIRGVLNPEEAERVRVEISRRLLEADTKDQVLTQTAPKTASFAAAFCVALAVVAATAVLYFYVGSPGANDQPLGARIAEADAARAERPSQNVYETQFLPKWVVPDNADPEFLTLMTQLRAAVRENPNDLEGNVLLARNEAGLGNFRAAHPAMAKVIELKGGEASVQDFERYLELMVMATQGYVSPEAEAVAGRVLAMEPRSGVARYFLGLMYAQSGRADRAYDIWGRLLRESTPQAPWSRPILAQIEQIAAAAGERYTPPAWATAPVAGLPGPSAEDMQAAENLDAEDRQAMIRGMVEGLAARLADQGGSAEEWARLVGALGVLRETERAAAIWAEAQEVFADDTTALELIRSAALQAGVTK